MNKFVTLVLLTVLLVAGIGAYWYVRPQHMPRILSDMLPGAVEMPTPRSPMTNFRPPQF